MAAHVDARDQSFVEAPTAEVDKSGWTERQVAQYRLGIWDGIEGHPVVPRELPEWEWVPNDEWRKGEGLLADHPEHDTTAARRTEREWELVHDERKFGSPRQR